MYSHYDNPGLSLEDVLSNGVTHSRALFESLVTQRSDRVHIVTEGDSWFDYPIGTNRDTIDWVVKSVGRTGLANVLRLESKGDTLKKITTEQVDVLRHVLVDNRKSGPVDFLLFSAGGNDIVQNLMKLLADYDDGQNARAYIDNCDELKKKLDCLEDLYVSLCKMVQASSPQTTVITHSYSYFVRFGDATDHLLRPNAAGPWVNEALEKKKVPSPMWGSVAQELVNRYYETLRGVLGHASVQASRFKIVDTRALLGPSDWADEIHPNDAGFRKVARKIYEQMIKCLGSHKSLPKFAG